MNEPALSTGLYWQSLPRPCDFKFSLGRAMEEVRHLEIHTNRQPVTGLAKAIEEGIKSGFTVHQSVIFLNIGKGQDIGAEIGAHCQRPTGVTPSLLAMDDLGLAAVVLLPDGGTAAMACRAYLDAFRRACALPGGACRLIVVFESDLHPHAGNDYPSNQTIVFDGMLSPEEIRAYVSVKMIKRTGPNRSNLLQALVTEFSGFDPMLAESLMALDDEQILTLPASLDLLYQNDHLRWREDSWGRGCVSYLSGEQRIHTMRQFYISKHPGRERAETENKLGVARWRACVNALLPWLELQRGYILQIFKAKLKAHAKADGGRVWVGKEKPRLIEIADMEYGDITYYTKNEISVVTKLEEAAVQFAWAAKRVRDEIAHLRAPNTEHVAQLMKTFEELER